MKKKIFILIAFMMLPINILGLSYNGCDYSDISRLKSLVSNVNISYDYYISDNTAYFNITLNNITPDMYFMDTANYKNYYYSDTNNGEITIYGYSNTSGGYKFYSAKNECYGTNIGSKYYNLPTYNRYYGDVLCEGIENYNLCQKWANVNYSYEEFKMLIDEYKYKDNIQNDGSQATEQKKDIFDLIINVYVKYYYLFLVAIILVCGVVIFVKRDKNKFKL